MEAALISASVSILLFIATQWWTAANVRADLLRLKLEEVHQRVSGLEKHPILPAPPALLNRSPDAMLPLLKQFQSEYRDYRVQKIQLSALIRLYFPQAAFHWREISDMAEGICTRSFARFHGKDTFDDDSEDQKLVDRINELLAYLETNQEELIKTPGWLFRNRLLG